MYRVPPRHIMTAYICLRNTVNLLILDSEIRVLFPGANIYIFEGSVGLCPAHCGTCPQYLEQDISNAVLDSRTSRKCRVVKMNKPNH